MAVPGRRRPGYPSAARGDQRSIFVNATEMYLRSIYELEEEEGYAPTRPALWARLGISRGAVAQHVGRLVDDGLVTLSPHRQLVLTEAGRAAAAVVMRKHRLAECLLVDVIGLEWELSHIEAMRWQHVLGDAVERKLLGLLDHPRRSPYGNPIPALGELSPGSGETDPGGRPLVRLDDLARNGGGRAVVREIQERLQGDSSRLAELRAAGVVPGGVVEVDPAEAADGRVRAAATAGALTIETGTARWILVEAQ